jgi:hypothetical protein
MCGAESEAAPNRLLCAACGSHHTRLVSGDELLLAQVELAVPDTEQDTGTANPPAQAPANSLH